jgi:hypothetical protein
MKTVTTILALIISLHLFGQKDSEAELAKIFYDLPIQSEIEIIIDSAKKVDLIEPNNSNLLVSTRPYFSGYIAKNDHISNYSKSGQIEIFRSSYYTLWGTELDSLDVIYIRLDYGNKITTYQKKDYKRLIRTFKKQTEKSEKYKLYADSGLIGYGYYFFKSPNDKLPFMAIEIGLGDCVSDSKSLSVSYYKIENYGVRLD